jgi:hypothetical protein
MIFFPMILIRWRLFFREGPQISSSPFYYSLKLESYGRVLAEPKEVLVTPNNILEQKMITPKLSYLDNSLTFEKYFDRHGYYLSKLFYSIIPPQSYTIPWHHSELYKTLLYRTINNLKVGRDIRFKDAKVSMVFAIHLWHDLGMQISEIKDFIS